MIYILYNELANNGHGKEPAYNLKATLEKES